MLSDLSVRLRKDRLTETLDDLMAMSEEQQADVVNHVLDILAPWVGILPGTHAAVMAMVREAEEGDTASYTLDFSESPRGGLTLRHANDAPVYAGEPSPGGRVVFPGLAGIGLD